MRTARGALRAVAGAADTNEVDGGDDGLAPSAAAGGDVDGEVEEEEGGEEETGEPGR
jgi:hypothetical protein